LHHDLRTSLLCCGDGAALAELHGLASLLPWLAGRSGELRPSVEFLSEVQLLLGFLTRPTEECP
jgi:hypothetical protein